MTVEQMLLQLREQPGSVEFEQVMALIDTDYRYSACDFHNGIAGDSVENPAGTNEGSCKIFAFARLHGLGKAQTLACFGRYYRDDVLRHPEGADHANIRTFLRHGPAGISFAGTVLEPRQ